MSYKFFHCKHVLGIDIIQKIWELKPKSFKEWEKYLISIDYESKINKYSRKEYIRFMTKQLVLRKTYRGYLAEKQFLRKYQNKTMYLRKSTPEEDKKGVDFWGYKKGLKDKIFYFQIKSTANPKEERIEVKHDKDMRIEWHYIYIPYDVSNI